MKFVQVPEPGKHSLFFRGDVINIRLSSDNFGAGKAYLRTNLGEAAIQREEIIKSVETGRPKSGQDWRDIPLVKVDQSCFETHVALLEAGHFEGKCYFLPANSEEPVWPEGDNFHINVESAEYCCANCVYCAFVRQFTSSKNLIASRPPVSDYSGVTELDRLGFAVIPPSGTFRNLIKELDFIIDGLNCRIIHLLPINPTPTVYGRMGRFGSPYASLGFMAVDPALA